MREPHEYEIAHLDGALIPLGQLPGRLDEIAEHKDDALVVVHCRSGARSAKAVQLLQEAGFKNPRQPEGRRSSLERRNRPVDAEVLVGTA